MKIGIISDIHSNIYGLKAVLEQLKETDLILCAGDITGYYTFPNEVLDLLKDKDVKFIKGNFDQFILNGYSSNELIQESIDFTRSVITPENLDILKTAPTQLEFIFDHIKIAIFHGSPWQVDEYINPDYDQFDKFQKVDADLIILGHTHKPMIYEIGSKIVVNPGSCGQPRDFDTRASFAIFDTQTSKAELNRVEYDYKEVINAVKKFNLSPRLIEILQRTK